jgi:hypothetical protein
MLFTVRDFTHLAMTSMPTLVRTLQEHTGRYGDEESKAWRASLRKLAEMLDDAELAPFHIHFSRQSGDLSLEYRLPASSSWCDVVLLGRGTENPAALMLELKNWNLADDRPGPRPGLVWHKGALTLHPSDQVRGYTEYCQRFHSAVQSADADIVGCALFTDSDDISAYVAHPHDELARAFPVFGSSTDDAAVRFPRFIREHLSEPDSEFATAFDRGHYSQDRDFVRCVADAILSETATEFVLLDGQRLGFERCLSVVDDLMSSGRDEKTVILVEGPPGSGKSVLAARLWATLAKDDRLHGGVVLVTTSGSQKSNWKSVYERVTGSRAAHGVVVPANQFNPGLSPAWVNEQRGYRRNLTIQSWQENLKLFSKLKGAARIRDNQMAISVVDEAHALIDPTAPGAEGIPPSGWSHHAGPQAWHIIRASMISIFFLDSEQSYRDNETTTPMSLQRFASEQGATVLESVSLAGSQFRCAGSREYVEWIDGLLSRGVVLDAPPSGQPSAGLGSFKLELVDDPEELEMRLRARVSEGRTARLLSSYGRPWLTKDEPRPHGLPSERMDFRVPYVRDGARRQWSRVWNYAPAQDYTLFIQAPEGSPMYDDMLCEVGCPYVVRGFDWDYVGVLWLSDLVWREDRWVPQIEHVHESAWKKTLAAAKAEARQGINGPATDRLLSRLTRGYRILLTRAIRGAYVWCEDEETRSYLGSVLGKRLPS